MAQMVLLEMVNHRDLYLAPVPNYRGINLLLQRRHLNGCKHYRRNLRQVVVVFSTGTLQGDECSQANPGIIQLRNCTFAP